MFAMFGFPLVRFDKMFPVRIRPTVSQHYQGEKIKVKPGNKRCDQKGNHVHDGRRLGHPKQHPSAQDVGNVESSAHGYVQTPYLEQYSHKHHRRYRVDELAHVVCVVSSFAHAQC